jgi:hypothetical protein
MNEAMAQKKLQSIKKLPMEEESFVSALAYVGDFYHHNTPIARKQLQDDLERRYMDSNAQFLQRLVSELLSFFFDCDCLFFFLS